MKKNRLNIYIIIILTFFSSKSFSQNNYLKVNIGGALPNGTQTRNTMPSDNETKAINFSLGKGMNYGVTLGHIVNKNITVELGIDYMIGLNTDLTVYKAKDANNIQKTLKETMKGSYISLTPAVVFNTEIGKFEPYARIGMIIALPTFKVTDTGDTITATNFKGGIAIGINSSLGVFYKFSDKISVYTEFSFTGLTYSPAKSEVTQMDVNEKSILNNLNVSDKKAEYNNSLTTDLSISELIDLNQPKQPLKQKYPFGSIGLNIGVRYIFK